MSKASRFNTHALLIGLAGIALVSGLTRAVLTGELSSSKKIQVTFWNGFTGPDGIVMLGIIDRFNAENPDIHVSMQRIPWATYYNKLTVAGSDGRGPSLFICHADALPRVRRAGFIDDASGVFQGDHRLDLNDFDPLVRDRITFKGHQLGVPLDIHPQGMYCDLDMLKSAGIVDAQGNGRPPRTKDEFMRAMTAMTREPSGAETEKQWGYNLTNWGNNFRSLIPQFDGHFFDAKGNADFNCPQNVRALEFLGRLFQEKRVPSPSAGQGWLGFRQKQVGMVWEGVYMVGDLRRVGTFQFAGAPIPVLGNHMGTSANSHVMCIRKGLTPETKDAVIRFIRYVSDHNLDWADAGQVPARVSARRDPRFATMQVQRAFAEQIPWMQYPPRTPLIFDLMLLLDLAAEKVVRQQATAQQALDDANKTAQADIDRDRLEHPEDQGA